MDYQPPPQDPQEFNPYAAPVEAQPVELFGSQRTLQTVATGFNLVFWGLLIMIISAFLFVFISIAAIGALNAAMRNALRA